MRKPAQCSQTPRACLAPGSHAPSVRTTGDGKDVAKAFCTLPLCSPNYPRVLPAHSRQQNPQTGATDSSLPQMWSLCPRKGRKSGYNIPASGSRAGAALRIQRPLALRDSSCSHMGPFLVLTAPRGHS